MTRPAAVISEGDIDAMADDGRLGVVAKRLAIESSVDWPSLDGEEQDGWHEQAIALLRTGSARARRYARDAAELARPERASARSKRR